MCGLFGSIGFIPHKNSVLSELSLLNMERGTDSTGVASINTRNGAFTIRKAPRNAADFLPQFRTTIAGDCIIGHTRHATCGSINTKNAHPWRIHNIIGAHNGMVWNETSVKRYLKEMYNDEVHYEVDSQYLLHMMAHYGNMGNAIGMLNLTYWDMLNNQLIMTAHKNPLNLAVDVNNRWAFWSSDSSHVKAIIDKYQMNVTVHSMQDEMFNISFSKKGRLEFEVAKVPFDTEYRNAALVEDDHRYYGYSKWWEQYPPISREEEDAFLYGDGVWTKDKQSATSKSKSDHYPNSIPYYVD